VSSIGLKLESDKDNDEDSEKDKEMDWGLYFSLLKNRGFSHEEILNLSYPQFNAYMNNINNPLSYAIVVPYMGGSDDKTEQLDSKEELMNIIADMNKDFL
jgi:hypothetical protein